ncbi:Shedu anti-phage system protein SduA domain-containing protein [Paraburkholderia sp. BL18I3N2]|uniref:Shedu anti-phage system protein SduA domain-containing protein n=1 Tax=Paraburkholderia sp. BL18I3N2 TaxID=1938799 RepID=UPI0011B21AA7|nr:Shedu anti-phage system protein SduA domain-containing protein [Paraburkholderia sp. BL18I3N2]
MTRTHSRASTKREAFLRAGYRCTFPGCNASLLSDSGIFTGEIANIKALSSGGAKYDATATLAEITDLDNLIVLCANHHRTIDFEAELYPIDWLRKVRREHELALLEKLVVPPVPSLVMPSAALHTLEHALEFWRRNSDNHDEQFWHDFFAANPFILALAFSDCNVLYLDKAYVGGKLIDNKGGNLLDFLYRSPITKNVVLIEIKTPQLPLLGGQYRANAFSVSEELSGSIVQVLNYRHELQNNYYSVMRDDLDKVTATAPRCMVLGGNIEQEQMNDTQRRSFELFRGSQQTHVVTYDELFAKIQNILDIGPLVDTHS